MSSATLPPPLSDTPTVETLERLLAGLHQPVQRGVPSPPDAERPLDEGIFESASPVTDPSVPGTAVTEPPAVAPSPTSVGPSPAPVAPAAAPAPAPTPAPAPAPDRAESTPLSWSAARARRGRWTPRATAVGVAAVTAAGVAAGLVATGELPLP